MKDRSANQVSAVDAAQLALEAIEGGAPVALVTVVVAPAAGGLGRRLVVTADAESGSLGAAELDERAVSLAREVLGNASCSLHEIELAGEVWGLYVEAQLKMPELVIVGAGHIGRALCRLGAMIGFRVTVLDDRAEYASPEWFPEAARVQVIDVDDAFASVEVGPDAYVVLVTRGHKYDYDCIQQLLRLGARPAYLGMIGSRRRVRAAFEALLSEGTDPARLADVRAPIGLDIGAETPEEIALAIAAELVATRRGGSGAALSGAERVLERTSRKLGSG